MGRRRKAGEADNLRRLNSCSRRARASAQVLQIATRSKGLYCPNNSAIGLRSEDEMKAISHFLRITVLGGVLFLTPIVVLAFILGKAFDLARRGLKPMATIIPDRFVSGATTEGILAIVLIAILCFLAGLFARTRPAQRIMTELESSVLSKVPAYEYLKQAGASVLGLGE